MDNKEALKKLIPMSDDELEDLTQNDIKISSPSLVEAPIHLNSPSKTIYGDFSMNSFVIVDTADAAVKEDNANVYMESIIDLFKSLNTKIDAFSKERSLEKAALGKVHGLLAANDTKEALNTLQQLRGGDIDISYLYEGLFYKTLPGFLVNIRQELVTVKENAILLRSCHSDLESKFLKRAEENERLKNMISQQSKDHKAQIDSLVAENNSIKDQLVKIHKDYGTSGSLESLLEEDILKEIRNLVCSKCRLIDDLREEVVKKDETIGQFERKASMLEVTHLNSQIESLRQTQHKLQDENLNLTQIVNKLSEKNTKLKQELLFFNSELKKAMELLGRKNETISRQKSLIELFQEKISGGSSFPVEELKKRKQEIDERLEKESDYFIKQRLKKEREDCSKRLSDFLNLQTTRKA